MKRIDETVFMDRSKADFYISKRKCDYCGRFAFLRDWRGLKFCFRDWFHEVTNPDTSNYLGGVWFEIKNTKIY